MKFAAFFLFILPINLLAVESTDTLLLIESGTLAARLQEPGLVIVDARASKEYALGHIDGAINIPVDSTFDSNSRTGLLAPVSSIQKLFSEAGIENDHRLVIYDSGRLLDAARLFWIFEVFGHQQLAILSTGFLDWKNKHLPVSTETNKLPPSNYLPAIKSDRLATAFSTRLAVEDDNKTILDARTPAEYQGQESKAQRFGHIPNARNIPADSLFLDNGEQKQLRPLEELQALFSDVDKNSRVITYCNKGKAAALTYFVLRNLGYDVAAYDGSWVEWGNDTSLPIVEPSSPLK